MRIKVHLHGYLRTVHPDPIEIEAATVREAIEGVTRQLDIFKPDPKHGRWVLQAVGYGDEDLLLPPKSDDLHLIPTFAGGKKGFFGILMGVAFVAASFLIPGTPGLLATLGRTVLSMGISMILGGLAQMFAPQPKMDTGGDGNPDPSKYLGARGNTVKIGTRIPILYGRNKVYGHYLSFQVDAKDVGL